MKCPYCNSTELKVTDKRNLEEQIRRRRECIKCQKRFTTYEKMENTLFMVEKKEGKREAYDREKIRKGIMRACEKRPVSMEKIDKVLDELENKLRKAKTTEIPSKKIGEFVVRKLKSLDKVAYIRFASVYRDFTDLQEFEEELKKLIKK